MKILSITIIILFLGTNQLKAQDVLNEISFEQLYQGLQNTDKRFINVLGESFSRQTFRVYELKRYYGTSLYFYRVYSDGKVSKIVQKKYVTHQLKLDSVIVDVKEIKVEKFEQKLEDLGFWNKEYEKSDDAICIDGGYLCIKVLKNEKHSFIKKVFTYNHCTEDKEYPAIIGNTFGEIFLDSKIKDI
ncbi:hypothetical protein [Flammeovirga sp. OC4]|uniref:hypothetical protein n=1 Tax=Flammeovirga sp. OC4 TaxID=1382345 RepID=UPI0005C5775D|nr:hypothetical protein [Flammeovirga sp. OC4]